MRWDGAHAARRRLLAGGALLAAAAALSRAEAQQEAGVAEARPAAAGDARGWIALAFVATDNNLACGGRQNVENMLVGLDGEQADGDGATFTVGAFIDETGYKPFTDQCPWSFPSSWLLGGEPWLPRQSAKLVELSQKSIEELATFAELDASEADVLTSFISIGFNLLGQPTDKRALWMSSHGNGWINFSLDWRCAEGQRFGKCEQTMTLDSLMNAFVTGLTELPPPPDGSEGALLAASKRPVPWPPSPPPVAESDARTALASWKDLPEYPSTYVPEEDRLALLTFDACYMATAEGTSAFARVADYVAMSMMTIPAQGQDYRTIFRFMRENPTSSPEEVGKVMLDSYTAYCDETAYGGPCTMVLVESSRWLAFEDDFANLVERFVRALDFKAWLEQLESEAPAAAAVAAPVADNGDVEEEEELPPTCQCKGSNDGINTAKYGENYGVACAAHDQVNCDAWWGPHGLGSWCCDAWCFVDPSACPNASPSLVAPNSGIFYSYDACTDADLPDDGTCAFKDADDDGPALSAEEIALGRIESVLVGISIAVQQSYVLQVPEGGIEANLVDLGSFLKKLSETLSPAIVDCCRDAAAAALESYNEAVLMYARRSDIPPSTTGMTIYFPRQFVEEQGSAVYDGIESSPLIMIWRGFLRDVYFPMGRKLQERCSFNTPDSAEARDHQTVAEAEAEACSCTGDNAGVDEAVYGVGYGTSCAAWEIAQGDDVEMCAALWGPDNPLSGVSVALGSWCCQSWCYVSRECPSARLSSVAPGSLLFYTYSPTGCSQPPEETCLARYADGENDEFEGTEEALDAESALAEEAAAAADDAKDRIACPGFRLEQSGARLTLTNVTASDAGIFLHTALKDAFCSSRASEAEATVTATQASCPCTGTNVGIDPLILSAVPAYGTSCAPWDAAQCRELWGNATELGAWCCRPWCYVDSANCSPPLSAKATFAANKLLFYSYDTCDEVSASEEPAAAEAFAADCEFSDASEDTARFDSGVAATKEECDAFIDEEPITEWQLTADAQGGIPLRAYTWAGMRITGVRGSFHVRSFAGNPDAFSTIEPGESRVMFLLERSASVAFFGGAGGATLTQVSGDWPGAFLALYQVGSDPLQTASWATVSVEASSGGDVRPATVRVLYGPRCGAPLERFVYGRLRLLLNATTLQQVTELDGVPVRPTLEVSHTRVHATDPDGNDDAFATGFHGSDTEFNEGEYEYDESIFNDDEGGEYDEGLGAEDASNERGSSSAGFFIDVPRGRGGVILPYALSVPEAHIESFVQSRNKQLRDATAQEGAGDPFHDDTDQVFFPATGYARCHLWAEDAPELGLAPFTIDMVGPMMRARKGGKQTVSEWTRVSPDENNTWSATEEERAALYVKTPHTFFRALQPSQDEADATSEVVLEPEVMLTAFDQAGAATMAVASRTPTGGVVTASGSDRAAGGENPLALMVPIPCPPSLHGEFDGAFESSQRDKPNKIVEDGYVRGLLPSPGNPGEIFLGMAGRAKEAELGVPGGLKDFCATSWCAPGDAASAASIASGEDVYAGYVTTAFGTCVYWERTQTGPLRIAVAISEQVPGSHTVLECPLSVTDRSRGVNGTLMLKSGGAPTNRWPCKQPARAA